MDHRWGKTIITQTVIVSIHIAISKVASVKEMWDFLTWRYFAPSQACLFSLLVYCTSSAARWYYWWVLHLVQRNLAADECPSSSALSSHFYLHIVHSSSRARVLMLHVWVHYAPTTRVWSHSFLVTSSFDRSHYGGDPLSFDYREDMITSSFCISFIGSTYDVGCLTLPDMCYWFTTCFRYQGSA